MLHQPCVKMCTRYTMKVGVACVYQGIWRKTRLLIYKKQFHNFILTISYYCPSIAHFSCISYIHTHTHTYILIIINVAENSVCIRKNIANDQFAKIFFSTIATVLCMYICIMQYNTIVNSLQCHLPTVACITYFLCTVLTHTHQNPCTKYRHTWYYNCIKWRSQGQAWQGTGPPKCLLCLPLKIDIL